MAIAQPHVQFLLSLRADIAEWRSVRSLMDIGEQNWFGASFTFTDTVALARALNLPVSAETEAAFLKAERDARDPFALAKLFYLHMLGIEEYAAIDLHGTPLAQPWDLNLPYQPSRQFDLLLNFGTTEHVFNQFEAFNTIHKLCKPGGFMVHALPHSGGREHGFFNYHSTFFFDLAAANAYTLKTFAWTGSVMKEGGREVRVTRAFADRMEYLSFIDGRPVGSEGFNICFQKAGDAPFVCPQQGYYDDNRSLGKSLEDFWKRNR
jgi:SAM-dependent methyltransferase